MNDIINRKNAGRLIYSVLAERVNVREAIKMLPETEDKSIECAYHALVHYAADEDLRYKDFDYRQEQDDYLEFLSYILERNEDLPENIIANYKQYYDSAPILHKKTLKGFFKSFWKTLNINQRRNK